MIKNLQLGDINKLKRFISFDINNNSKLYYEDNLLHKIPKKINDSLPKILTYIDDNNIKWLVKVVNFIEDKDKIVGYTMMKYDNYKSLSKYKYRDIDLKINDSIKIINAFDYFNNKNLLYKDCHTGNILLNKDNNDIKICDLDSFELCNYKIAKNKQLFKVFELCISYLYNLNSQISYILVNRSTSNIDNDNYIRECLKSVGTKSFQSKVKKLKYIDKTKIKDDRKRMITEAKNYMNSGYYKYY